MSGTIWVDIQGRGKGEIPQDNSIMLRLKDELDRSSDKLRVPKLSQFYDYSELEAQFADFDEEASPTDAEDTSEGQQSQCGCYAVRARLT